MAKPLTERMAQALREGKPRALFAEIDHPDGLARFWTGVGDIAWNGETWKGVGVLGGVAPVRQSTAIEIQELIFTLSGVKPDDATWLSADVSGREAQVWLACIDGFAVVADPYYLFEARLDYQNLSVEESGSAKITLNALSGFYTLQRAIEEVWSAEDQQNTFPDDTGFSRIARLQNQEVKWSAT